ncbi:MFS transporter [Pseudomonas brenneri]|uniref:MFS transporter n=1 Tax=Pseudomonas brenneri TaxID=129817 RepID=UPI0035709D2D
MSAAAPAAAAATAPVFNSRLAVGLLGVLVAAMMAGLANRVPGLVLADVQGGLGFARDDISWLATTFSAGELAAMPFAAWFAITLSMRRFLVTMLVLSLALSAIIPWVHDLPLLLLLRTLQGVFAGALIPVLMMAALRFLPAPIRLHGLALFAMTATLSPNIAFWLGALSVEYFADWRWVYWHAIPLQLLAMVMIAWGIPDMPAMLHRLKQANWFGMLLGIPGLMLIVVGIDQGVRLDWFHSPIIVAALLVGLVFTVLYLTSEWLHPAPFVQFGFLKRRNIWLGFITMMLLMVAMSTAVSLPTNILGRLHGFRIEQSASLGLMVGLPQLFLGSCVALLLYQRWIDARHTFALGLACMAGACWFASGVTSEWMVQQFQWATVLHIVGQPLAMVSMLFLVVSVVQPMEGPFFAGLVNIVRVFSTILGGAFTGQLMMVRGQFHTETLIGGAAQSTFALPHFGLTQEQLAATIARQADTLAGADVFRVIGLLVLLLIPVVLALKHIPAPVLPPSSSRQPS